MRIVQIIDSLEAGGAERMAVNYANALAIELPFAALVSTRKEGSLKQQIDGNVSYLFLQKKGAIDITAVLRLRQFCKKQNIDYLHAHSSSFFIAVLVKLSLPKIKIIWHDHDGMSEFLEQRKTFFLSVASIFFSGIISVNNKLKAWAEQKLKCKNVIYIPNFTGSGSTEQHTVLSGEKGKRILCLANLRPQKNHLLLVEVAKLLKKSHPDWSFHLVGKDFKDDYANVIRDSIATNGLKQYVYIYGSRNDTNAIIAQSDIAILTSKSEGLPVSLLEYGFHKKPVVVTNVGEIPSIIKANLNGSIVENDNVNQFYSAIVKLIENESLRMNLGQTLYEDIMQNYSEQAIIKKYLDWLNIVAYAK